MSYKLIIFFSIDFYNHLAQVQQRKMSTSEPSNFVVFIVRVAQWIIKPYYRRYVKNNLPINEDDRIMDFGSGPGAMSSQIIKRLNPVVGTLTCIDISKRWIAICQKKFRKRDNVDYYLGMITESNIPDNSYDKIIIHFVLHDIRKNERQAIINALYLKLKLGGKLIIRDPTNPNHGMPTEEIKDLMRKVGFKEESSKLSRRSFVGIVFDGVFIK